MGQKAYGGFIKFFYVTWAVKLYLVNPVLRQTIQVSKETFSPHLNKVFLYIPVTNQFKLFG